MDCLCSLCLCLAAPTPRVAGAISAAHTFPCAQVSELLAAVLIVGRQHLFGAEQASGGEDARERFRKSSPRSS